MKPFFNVHLSRLRIAAPAAILMAAGLGLFGMTPALAIQTVSHHPDRALQVSAVNFKLITAVKGAKFLGEHELSDGDYSAKWRIAGHTVTVAGAAGSTVTFSEGNYGKSEYAKASISSPARPRGETLQQVATAYARGRKSPAIDARAIGYSPARASRVSPDSTGKFLWSGCVSVTGDAGNAWGKACDSQYLVQQVGGDWYVGDETTGSGSDNDRIDSLEGVAAYVEYKSGNSLTRYSPTGTTQVTNCGTTKTWSVGWNGNTMSSATTDCPGSLSPYGLPSSLEFGSKWAACDSGNQIDGVASDDVFHSPSGANPTVSVSSQIWWGDC